MMMLAHLNAHLSAHLSAHLATAIAAGLMLMAACSSYDVNDRIDPTVGTNVSDAGIGVDFRPVATMLVGRCGSIDCHGSKYRNFRLYGFGSQRLPTSDPNVGPDTKFDGQFLSEAESVEDFNAMVALEPTIYLQVIREGGAAPDRLTLMRKARNHENHKGNKPIVEGDAADLCLQAWLQQRMTQDIADGCILAAGFGSQL